jgi:hypothetical protein
MPIMYLAWNVMALYVDSLLSILIQIGMTAVVLATVGGHESIVASLLEAKASPHVSYVRQTFLFELANVSFCSLFSDAIRQYQ